MLVKKRSLSASLYMEAVDYVNALKKEGKYNITSLSVFNSLYPAQSSSLFKQGFFNSSNN